MNRKIVCIMIFALSINLAACGTGQSPDDPVSSASNDSQPAAPDSSDGGNGELPGSVQEPPTEWQSFVDQEFNFKIDYPQSYTAVVNPELTQDIEPAPIHQIQFQEILGDIELVQFYIEVFDNSDGTPLEEWLDANAPDSSRAPVKFNNLSGYLITLNMEISPNQFYYFDDELYVYKLTPLGPYGQEMLNSFTLE